MRRRESRLNQNKYNNSSNDSINSETNEISEYYSPLPFQIPTEGIKYENIFNKNEPILKDLECPICLNLIWDPYECSDCGKIFCKICIEKTKKTKNSCPTCRKTPFQGRNAKSLKTFFNKIKINCINKGCNEHPEYSEYISHIKKCKFRLYKCNNPGCDYQDNLEKMEIHSTECKFLLVKCQYCLKEINLYKVETHEKTECTQIMNCPKCHLKMSKDNYHSKHRKNNTDSKECQKEQIRLNKNEIKDLLNKLELLKSKHTKKENGYKSTISELKKKLKTETDKNEKLIKSIDELKNEKTKTEKCLKFYKNIFFSFLILLISFIIFIFTKLI